MNTVRFLCACFINGWKSQLFPVTNALPKYRVRLKCSVYFLCFAFWLVLCVVITGHGKTARLCDFSLTVLIYLSVDSLVFVCSSKRTEQLKLFAFWSNRLDHFGCCCCYCFPVCHFVVVVVELRCIESIKLHVHRLRYQYIASIAHVQNKKKECTSYNFFPELPFDVLF